MESGEPYSKSRGSFSTLCELPLPPAPSPSSLFPFELRPRLISSSSSHHSIPRLLTSIKGLSSKSHCFPLNSPHSLDFFPYSETLATRKYLLGCPPSGMNKQYGFDKNCTGYCRECTSYFDFLGFLLLLLPLFLSLIYRYSLTLQFNANAMVSVHAKACMVFSKFAIPVELRIPSWGMNVVFLMSQAGLPVSAVQRGVLVRFPITSSFDTQQTVVCSGTLHHF